MGVTDLLCQALQRKSLDILNAMDKVSSTKALLQTLRDEGFDSILGLAKSHCEEYGIDIPNMDGLHKIIRGRSCQQKDSIPVEHHYLFDVFPSVIDFQMVDLNNRFIDAAIELLKLSSALEPKEGFKLFDIDQICLLAEKFYHGDFTNQEMHCLRSQLGYYLHDVLQNERFQNISTLLDFCQKLVVTNKAQDYNLIDMLIRLVLTLLVSTATTERTFSAMKRVKSVLRNKMDDEYLSTSMVIYIERELAENIDTDSIIDQFNTMGDRRKKIV